MFANVLYIEAMSISSDIVPFDFASIRSLIRNFTVTFNVVYNDSVAHARAGRLGSALSAFLTNDNSPVPGSSHDYFVYLYDLIVLMFLDE